MGDRFGFGMTGLASFARKPLENNSQRLGMLGETRTHWLLTGLGSKTFCPAYQSSGHIYVALTLRFASILKISELNQDMSPKIYVTDFCCLNTLCREMPGLSDFIF